MTEINHDYDTDLLRKYENWDVYMHENQTYLGRMYVALARDGEIDPFMDTTPDEQAEFLIVVQGIKSAVDKLYRPERLNYANLRNTWLHCHWHIIPRYNEPRTVLGHVFDDPNKGKNYAPSPNADIPPDVYEKIKADLTTELNR